MVANESSDGTAARPPEPAPGASEEMALVEALRRGDAKAFESLVDSYTATMLKLARSYVQSTHAAEDVVQETWMAVVTGIERFEGRSSLKTWIFRILVNRARSRSRGDRRFDLGPAQTGGDEAPGPSVDQARFETSGRWAGHWAVPPAPLPEDRLLSAELRAVINRLIDRLPPRQRSVLVLRDVEGLSAAEACEVLGLSEANQRVLLHRARVKVRDLLEMILDEEMSA